LDITVSPYNIITTIELHEAIYSASDGSVKDKQGSFGWLLSSPNGTVILRCSVPAFGMCMKSYRAEGYGVLSVLRLIYRLYTFCNQPLPTNLHLFCHSKSLLDKTAIYTKHTRYFPNTSLQPDWDVVQQIVTTIVTTICMFPNPPHLTHVKAHQDHDASYDKLPVESQLKVQADTLTKNYNLFASHATTTVPRLSCNAAQLHCQGQTVTFRYCRTVCREALSPAILQYIMERSHWTAADMERVHWEAHGQALKKNYVHYTFLVKLIHDKLPVGKYCPLQGLLQP
jgi:hypothetical protein